MDTSDFNAVLPAPSHRVPAMRPPMVTGMAIHAGIYVRQSERQVTGSEASTTTQREECVKAAEGWDLPPDHIEVYEDLGVSAFKDVARPAYERLLRDARAGRVNVIVVHYMSRLSRRTAAQTISELRPLLMNRVRIVSVGEHREFHADDQSALEELLFKLQAGHEESLNKSQAIRAVKALEASLGGYTGKAPFGFTLAHEIRRSTDGRPVNVKILTPDAEHEAPIVRRIVEMVEGWIAAGDTSGTCWKLARQLEAEGLLTRGRRTAQRRADASWDGSTVRRILTDPRIAGFACESVYGTRRDGTPSNKVAEYRIVRDTHGVPLPAYEPIVSPERWYRVQDWVGVRHPGGGDRQSRPSGVLSAMELLYCECGAYMTHGGTGSRKHYRCRRRTAQPGQHTGDVTIGAKGIEEYLARQVLAVIATPGTDEAAHTVLAIASARYASDQERQEPPQIAEERDWLLTERANLRLARRQQQPESPEDHALAERMRTLDARIAGLGADEVELPRGAWLPQDGSDPISTGSWWNQATRDDKRGFFRLFLDRVEVRKAYRWAGQSVPTGSRVRVTWAGGIDLDVLP
ncbi:recombinase family protein [Streptomyces pseudovenezuelae]|uniref:recombinase family protein n=1 Tax=Streptomyces pseudovenezuelae TaxID=67350 RepID=UPI0036E22899